MKLHKLEPSIGDSRSDGHIYKALMKPLVRGIESLLVKDPLLLREDDYFLIKREKLLLLGQIVEKGAGHSVVAIKGAELQEQTECHQHESESIERMANQ